MRSIWSRLTLPTVALLAFGTFGAFTDNVAVTIGWAIIFAGSYVGEIIHGDNG